MATTTRSIPGMFGEPHTSCIVCGIHGHAPGETCSAFCDAVQLVEHCREHMCPGCVAAFDVEIETGRPVLGSASCVRCQGTGGDCCSACEGAGTYYVVEAVPELVLEEVETEPTKVEPYESVDATAERWWSRLAVAALFLAAAVGLQACSAHRQPPEVESVGRLAAGPSVYSAPVAHDAPPELGFVAGSDDDSTGEVATTVSRAGAAPEVAPRANGLTMGGAR